MWLGLKRFGQGGGGLFFLLVLSSLSLSLSRSLTLYLYLSRRPPHPPTPGSFVNFPEPRPHALDGPGYCQALGWVPGLQLMTRSPGSFSFARIRTPRSVSSPERRAQMRRKEGGARGD